MNIAVFYHCAFLLGEPPELVNLDIIIEQMHALKVSGLEDAASEIYCGVNGGEESEIFARGLLPSKAHITYHGRNCRNECRTIAMTEEWAKTHGDDWLCLYFHSKGISHPADSAYGNNMSRPWRNRMMNTCVHNWRQCVADLAVHEAVGAHWLTGQGWDKSQHYFAGTFWFARASFLRTLPSIHERERIKTSGIDSIESRYEAEITLGNGPRLPIVRNYYSGPIGT